MGWPVTGRSSTSGADSRTLVAVAVAVYLLLDVLRVCLPVLTAGPLAGARGVVVLLGCLLAAAVAVPFGGGASISVVLLSAAVVTGLARVFLQTGPTGVGQAIGVCAALVGVVVWLVTAAGDGVPARSVAVGSGAGLALSTTLQVSLGTSATWTPGLTGWLVAGAGSAVFGLASTGWPASRRDSPARLWLAVGPAVLLTGIVTGVAARTTAGSTPASHWPQLVLVAAAVSGVAAASRWAGRWRPAWLPGLLLVLSIAGSLLPRSTRDGVEGLLPAWTVAPHAVAAFALAAVLGEIAGGRTGQTTRRLAALAGVLLLVLVGLAYYGAYGVGLDRGNDLLMVAVSMLLAGLSVRRTAGRSDAWRRPLATTSVVVSVGALVVAVAAAAVGLDRRSAPGPSGEGDLPLRLMTYNVHAGVSTEGRVDVDAIADVIEAEAPDVVALNEVDRGWLANGGQDVLLLLATRLDLGYLYAPAAGPMWGDAVLSRFPMRTVSQQALPADGPATGAQALAVVIGLADGQELGLVVTHLQGVGSDIRPPPEQAAAVADLAAQLAGGNRRPVVVAGDLNAAPGHPALAALDVELTDALARWRPVLTYPADDPADQRDQIYVTGQLDVSALAVPRSEASDHLPIVVTLSRG